MAQITILAFDYGTSGVKAALVTGEGKIIACETENYSLYVPQAGFAEQNPEEYWQALVKCIHRIGEKHDFKDLVGISLCTQWKGMIPLDKDGNVLHNNVIWMDARATEQAKSMNEATGSDFFSAQNYWSRLKWCHDKLGDTYSKADSILEVNSFIKWKLTGEKVADISNDFIHSYDPKQHEFYQRNRTLTGLEDSKFPRLSLSTDMVGKVNKYASEMTGLPQGVPVFSGSGDIPAIAIGSGCPGVGKVHAYFGTSGWVGKVYDHRFENILSLPASAFTKDRDIVLAQTLQSVGSSFNWTLRQLYHNEFQTMGNGVFDLVNKEVENVPAGSEGVMATPWIAGELPPKSERARTVFVGMGLGHDRSHMVNAMMEGICYSMKGYFMKNHDVDCLSVVGGGANSDHWMQTLANVIQTQVSVPENNQHAGALGAAVCALVGLGYYKDLDQATAFVKEKRHFWPDSSKAKLYDELFDVYEKLYPCLDDTFTRLQKCARGEL